MPINLFGRHRTKWFLTIVLIWFCGIFYYVTSSFKLVPYKESKHRNERKSQVNLDLFGGNLEQYIDQIDNNYKEEQQIIERKGLSDRLEKLHKGFKTAKQKDTENKIIVNDDVSSHLEVGSVPWQQFDVERYVGATALRRGENPYHRNKFNQLESYKLKPDRNVMDTRHSHSFTKTNNKYGLRTIFCPANIDQDFRRIAVNNTARNIETCGLLFGNIKNDIFVITHVLVPHQTGKPDSCDVTRDEDLFEFSEYCNGVCLGWIHTHPSQTAFLSSVDMHTHYPNQLILPESVAIVCSDKYKETGYFMLTPEHGMKVIGNCRLKGFHPHQNNPPLFEECSHVIVTKDQNAQVVDWRNK